MGEQEKFFENKILGEKLTKSTQLLRKFRNKTLKIEILGISLCSKIESMIKLIQVAKIFQKQLPSMPKNYVLQQVFNLKNFSLALIKDNEIVGATLYRPFHERNFAEIVFLAVDAEYQIKGYGIFILEFLKEHFKKEVLYFYKNEVKIDEKTGILNDYKGMEKKDDNEYLDGINEIEVEKYCKDIRCVYFYTYADHYALTFFRKQGFSPIKTTDDWRGFVKDYDGGTLVECVIDWNFNFIKKAENILEQKAKIYEKIVEKKLIRKINSKEEILKIVEENNKNYQENPNIISSTQSAFEYILYMVMEDPHSYAFLHPVSEAEVPGYKNIIKTPMDLNTILGKVKDKEYNSFTIFKRDFKIIVRNCREFNGEDSIYTRNVKKIEKIFCDLCDLTEKRLNQRFN